jgi:polar amino acid transport system substrate-binding protein
MELPAMMQAEVEPRQNHLSDCKIKRKPNFRGLLPLFLLVFGLSTLVCGALQAAESVTIPGFWDPKRRVEKPPSSGTVVRFLTSPDYAPFNYLNPAGELTGFNVDLARALCKELEINCTIQARAWEGLLPALRDNLGDALISGFSGSPALRKEADLTDTYFKTPARFAFSHNSSIDTPTPETLRGKTIGVIKGSSHAAFLDFYFDSAKIARFDKLPAMEAALKSKSLDAIFGDGVQLALWLNTQDGSCCTFRGGPYLESRFFGEGQVIAVKKGGNQLRRLLNYGLQQLYEKGVYTELYLKWFPVSVF